MAPRKPNYFGSLAEYKESIVDDIVGGFVGAAKGVGNWSQSQARTFTNPYINAAGRAIGKNPNLPVSGAKEAITNTAFGVVDIASGPIGRVAAKGAKAAAGAVAKTGLPARVVNKVTGQKVVVIGTKSVDVPRINKGYYGPDWVPNPLKKGDMLPTVSGVVKPAQTIYPALKDTPVRWGFDPSKSESIQELTKNVSDYTDRWFQQANTKRINDRLEFGGWYTPEIAVTKVPKSALSYEPIMPNWPMTDAQIEAVKAVSKGGDYVKGTFRSGAVASTTPAKVVSTVSPVLPDPTALGAKYLRTKKPVHVLERELEKEIKRAGGKIKRRK